MEKKITTGISNSVKAKVSPFAWGSKVSSVVNTQAKIISNSIIDSIQEAATNQNFSQQIYDTGGKITGVTIESTSTIIQKTMENNDTTNTAINTIAQSVHSNMDVAISGAGIAGIIIGVLVLIVIIIIIVAVIKGRGKGRGKGSGGEDNNISMSPDALESLMHTHGNRRYKEGHSEGVEKGKSEKKGACTIM